jgi:hypothetical protein
LPRGHHPSVRPFDGDDDDGIIYHQDCEKEHEEVYERYRNLKP